MALLGGVTLDLNMPNMEGREALRAIKAVTSVWHIPVVVMTTSKAEEDIYRTYDLGVSSFVTKPVTFDGLVAIMRSIGKYWFEIVELPAPVGLSAGTSPLRQLYRNTTCFGRGVARRGRSSAAPGGSDQRASGSNARERDRHRFDRKFAVGAGPDSRKGRCLEIAASGKIGAEMCTA